MIPIWLNQNILLLFLIIFFPCAVFSIGFSPAEINVPVKGVQKVFLKQAKNKEYTVDIYNPNVATLKVNRMDHSVLIYGKSAGQTIVMVVDNLGGVSAARVVVKEIAGKLPDSLMIQVSGNPCPYDQVREAILKSLSGHSGLKRGASLILDKLEMNEQLQQGEWAAGSAKIQAIGENYFTANQTVTLLVENQKQLPKADDFLFMSNNPEVVTAPGYLFSDKLGLGQAARFVFHHGNIVAGDLKFLNVYLKNLSEVPAKVWVALSVSGPSADSIFVGHSAAKRYLEKLINDEGIIVELPPHSRLQMLSQKIPAGQYASGIVRVVVLEGSDVGLDLISENEESGLSELQVLPFDNIRSHIRGKIPSPNLDFERAFSASEKYHMFEIGMAPKLYNGESQLLVGNYGIYHTYRLTLRNDHERSSKMQVSVLPRGGFFRGCFLVNKEFVETRVLDPYVAEDDQIIYNVLLGPREKKDLEIFTFPQPGSYLPIQLILRSS